MGPAAGTGWHRLQLARSGDGRPPRLRIPALAAALDYMVKDMAQAATSRRSRMRLAERTPAPEARAEAARSASGHG